MQSLFTQASSGTLADPMCIPYVAIAPCDMDFAQLADT